MELLAILAPLPGTYGRQSRLTGTKRTDTVGEKISALKAPQIKKRGARHLAARPAFLENKSYL